MTEQPYISCSCGAARREAGGEHLRDCFVYWRERGYVLAAATERSDGAVSPLVEAVKSIADEIDRYVTSMTVTATPTHERWRDALRAALANPTGSPCTAFAVDAAHIDRQREWSEATFGGGRRTAGVTDHIRKELTEIEAAPDDLREWVDVIILAFDGAWRCIDRDADPQVILDAILAKQKVNEDRTWPDWRTAPPDKAIEHDRAAQALIERSQSEAERP